MIRFLFTVALVVSMIVLVAWMILSAVLGAVTPY